jgi:exosortase K
VKSKLCVLAVAALAAWGMKRHYADAGADDLWWILSPTAQVVGTVTNTAFVAVPAEGYVSYERLVVIEKSCAGINFLVAAFGMLTIALLHRVRSASSGLGVVAASLSAGYLAAVFVNATRITIALWLADRPSAVLSLGAGQMHRLEGIVVYFAGLVLLAEIARRIDRRTSFTGRIA